MQLPNKPLTSAIEAIGNTPLVELARITKRVNGSILVKLENLNPGYSKKDRIARQIIADAEASGELAPGQTVVELTSGNTGTGRAIVCGIKGYPEHVDGYRSVSDDRAIQMARRLAREEGIFAGFSSGANVTAAMDLLHESFKGKTAVVLICDSGLKYFSTDLWE